MGKGRISRREMLKRVALLTGAAGVYSIMDALNLNARARGEDYRPVPGDQSTGKGKHVLIIGAGIAGLTSAFELSKRGFKCTIVEASRRSGGRIWTIRKGDTLVETDGRQKCSFESSHSYFNIGASRIPYHTSSICTPAMFQSTLSPCQQARRPLAPMSS